ncbi:hypothetical protein C8J57DRAFT_344800 [Mycena rebaudengoi]|nr:hypothetical protein C8J57DRAFT_344800 [Mycena rebaudengoi]
MMFQSIHKSIFYLPYKLRGVVAGAPRSLFPSLLAIHTSLPPSQFPRSSLCLLSHTFFCSSYWTSLPYHSEYLRVLANLLPCCDHLVPPPNFLAPYRALPPPCSRPADASNPILPPPPRTPRVARPRCFFIRHLVLSPFGPSVRYFIDSPVLINASKLMQVHLILFLDQVSQLQVRSMNVSNAPLFEIRRVFWNFRRQYPSPFQGNSSLILIRLSFTFLIELFFPLNVVGIFSDYILDPTAGKFRESLLTERLFHYEIKSSADSRRLESKGSLSSRLGARPGA